MQTTYKDEQRSRSPTAGPCPFEVSRAIDAVGRDPRFAPLLMLDQCRRLPRHVRPAYAALELAEAAGRRRASRRHCEADLVADFSACVGLITQLDGGPLDGIRKWAALAVIRHRFSGETWRAHASPRIVAVAGVPFAADFDMASLAGPEDGLGLVTAAHDRWLVPRFNSDRVLEVCKSCEHIADFANGGHGALLSPLPPGLTGLVGQLLNDPPGFDRGEAPVVDRKITAFFLAHLPPVRSDPSLAPLAAAASTSLAARLNSFTARIAP